MFEEAMPSRTRSWDIFKVVCADTTWMTPNRRARFKTVVLRRNLQNVKLWDGYASLS